MGRFDEIHPIGPPAAAGGGAPGGPEPYSAEHFMAEATLAMERGRWESALRLFGRALQRDRSSEAAWVGQVRALVEMSQPGEAATWAEQAAKVCGESAEILALKATCAARTGKPDEAMAWSDRAMSQGRDEGQVWASRAEALFASGHGEMARRALEKAAERSPEPAMLRKYGEIALFFGDLRLAQLWLERARSLAPDDPLAALQLGVLRDRQDDLVAARIELDRALALEPGLKSARLALRDLNSRTKIQRVFSRVRRWFDG
jgi:tetratricopeptide (TPR) repeat protein